MDSRSIKSVVLCIIFGIIWGTILYELGVFIVQNSNEKLSDILFIEGIICILFGIFSHVGGNSIGIYMQGLEENNAHYIGNLNLSISKIEKSKFKSNIRSIVSLSLSMVSFIVAGTICFGINFIL